LIRVVSHLRTTCPNQLSLCHHTDSFQSNSSPSVFLDDDGHGDDDDDDPPDDDDDEVNKC